MAKASQIPLLSELQSPPVVGETYRVPVVDYPLRELRYQSRYIDEEWPVIGPKHNDKAIGFPIAHYHIDVRFLRPDQEKFAQTYGELVLEELRNLPRETAHQRGGLRDGATPLQAFNIGTQLTEHSGQRLPKPVLRERVCIRSEMTHAVDYTLQRFQPLAECAKNARYNVEWINGRPHCPHFHTDLSTCPVKDGWVQCPVHGLNLRLAAPETEARPSDG